MLYRLVGRHGITWMRKLRKANYINKAGSPPSYQLAGGRGFEPRLTDPESVVLPLDDPPSTPNSLPKRWLLWQTRN